MYCLEVIRSINNRKVVKSAVQERQASYNASASGVVLHSAIHRDTVFIHKGERADSFLRIVRRYESVGNRAAINALIERIYTKASA